METSLPNCDGVKESLHCVSALKEENAYAFYAFASLYSNIKSHTTMKQLFSSYLANEISLTNLSQGILTDATIHPTIKSAWESLIRRQKIPTYVESLLLSLSALFVSHNISIASFISFITLFANKIERNYLPYLAFIEACSPYLLCTLSDSLESFMELTFTLGKEIIEFVNPHSKSHNVNYSNLEEERVSRRVSQSYEVDTLDYPAYPYYLLTNNNANCVFGGSEGEELRYSGAAERLRNVLFAKYNRLIEELDVLDNTISSSLHLESETMLKSFIKQTYGEDYVFLVKQTYLPVFQSRAAAIQEHALAKKKHISTMLSEILLPLGNFNKKTTLSTFTLTPNPECLKVLSFACTDFEREVINTIWNVFYTGKHRFIVCVPAVCEFAKCMCGALASLDKMFALVSEDDVLGNAETTIFNHYMPNTYSQCSQVYSFACKFFEKSAMGKKEMKKMVDESVSAIGKGAPWLYDSCFWYLRMKRVCSFISFSDDRWKSMIDLSINIRRPELALSLCRQIYPFEISVLHFDSQSMKFRVK